jgi:hypothetical protein
MVEQCGELRYSDPLDKLRGTQACRHGPSPRERMAEQRRLDTPIPSWEDIDTRIGQWLEVERQKFEQTLAARLEEERAFWHEVTARALAKILDDVEQRPGPQGPPGPAGKLPTVRVWKTEQVTYENEVFAYKADAIRRSAIPRRSRAAVIGSRSLALAVTASFRSYVAPTIRKSRTRGSILLR